MEKVVVERAGNLSAAQVKKYAWRVELFLKKCTGEGTVKVRSTGEEVTINPAGDNTKRTVEELTRYLNGEGDFRGSYSVDTDKGTFPISALEKTEEFGGGAGVAGGSDLTKTVEAGQCIKNMDYSNCTVSLGKGETIGSILANYDELSEDWKQSIDAIGKELGAEFQTGVWHWQDEFVQSIQDVYYNLDDKLAGTFDRYNPADIWYTNQSYNSISDLMPEKPEYLEELTKVLNTAFKDRVAVGVSLKKTTKPNLVPYTGEKRRVKFDLEDIIVSKRTEGTLYFNITFKVDGEDHLCQIRKDNLGYRATVKLTNRKNGDHYDGSVGKGIILHCLGKVYKGDLKVCEPSYWYREENRQLAEYILNHLALFNRDDIEEAEILLNEVYPTQILDKEPETFRKGEFNTAEEVIGKSLDAIVKILNDDSVGEKGRKEFLGRLVRYAWSLHTDSCDFLKVCS